MREIWMFLRKKLFSRLSTHRLLFIGLAALIGVQPILVAVALNRDQQRRYDRFVEKLLQQSTGDQSKAAFTAAAVGPLSCMQNKKIIIDANAWLELQGDALVKVLSDKAETSFGREVLRQTLQQPTDDTERIGMRQKQVQALMDDPKLFDAVGKELQRIKKAEDSILTYWDESQQENQGALFARSNDFYYSKLTRWFGDRMNNGAWSLEASSTWQFSRTIFELLLLLGMDGFLDELRRYSEDPRSNKKFDPVAAVLNGVKKPLNCINPWPTSLGKNYDASAGAFSDIVNGTKGSFGDLVQAAHRGVNQVGKVEYRGVGRGVKWMATNMPRPVPSCIDKNCCCVGGCTPCRNIANAFNDDGAFIHTSKENANTDSMWSWGAAVGGASVYTYLKTGVMLYRLRTAWRQVKQYVSTMKELHIHTIHMARAMHAMQKLAGMVCDHEVFRASCTAEHMHEVIGHPSEDLQKLFEVLKKSTFTLSKAKSHVYSRGNVLLAHRMFGKVKDELVPLLQGIGELDAAYAMASNIKAHQYSDTPFTFVEFVPDAQATIKLEQAWLPMVKQPVANTITLGGGAHPNKIIITGPNGGGKSVFLKTLGCCVLLAQSWGIVPAKKAQMSLFDGVCSCIHPQESIEHELSTFMAEKLRIDAIRQYVFQNNKPGFKGLLLLDEPFKGTVDAESADRIYEFGKEIAPLNGLIVSIATHVEKPINLAPNTGAYANYHVCINELPGGIFERKFTIEPGVLRWWFDDPAKRSKFIDFVTIEKHKEQLKQSAAA